MYSLRLKCAVHSSWRRVYSSVLIFHILWSIASSTKTVPIAVLLPKNNAMWFSISRVKPASDLALESTTAYLDNTTTKLTVKYADSMCSNAEAMNVAIEFYIRGEVNAFFGPCCDYAAAAVGRQARYWDLPVLTSGAMAGDFGVHKEKIFSMLTRVGPDINSLAGFVLATLNYHKWSKVKLLFEPLGQMGVFEKFCHFATDGIQNAILNSNITKDHFKFNKKEEIIDKLNVEIGNTYAGKSIKICQ